MLKPPQSVNGTNRRDSGNSTISSFYGSSVRSDGGQNSRRSSAMSQVSAAVQGISPSTVNGRAVTNASPYDPISPGSSRRSSGVDQATGTCTDNQPNSLASSSNTLTSSIQAHFQKLHRKALGLSGDYGVDHPTNASTSTLAPHSNGNRNETSSAFATFIAPGRQIGNSQEIRRMSDPCSSGSRQHGAFNGMGNHPAYQRHQAHNFTPSNVNNAMAAGGTLPAGHQQQTNANTNVNGSFGDEILIPDEMASFIQSGGNMGVTNNNTVNSMRQGCDQARPSTCPPASINQLPPPPPYNQAVAAHQNNGIIQGARQNPHLNQANVAAAYTGNAPSGYNNMSVGSPSAYGSSANGSAAVPSPYTQVNSPAYSHSSVMSPKNPSVPLHSPMSISCMSPATAVPPSPSSHAVNRNPVPGNMQPPAAVEGSSMMTSVTPNTNNGAYCPPPQSQQQQAHAQVPTQPTQNYPYHNNNHQQYQAYGSNNSSSNGYGSNNYGTTAYPQHGNGSMQYNQQQTTGFYNANSSHYSAHFNNGNYSTSSATQSYGYNGNHNQHYNCQCPPQQHGSNRSSHNHHHHQQTYWQQNQQQSQTSTAYSAAQNPQTHNGSSSTGNWNAGQQQNMMTTQGHYQGWNSHCYQNSGNIPAASNFSKCSQNHTGADVKPFRRNQHGNISHEIQCQSVTSQSQSSQRMTSTGPNNAVSRGNTSVPTTTPHNSNCHNNNRLAASSNNPPVGMRPDTYQRTLEYVQQCQLWSSTEHKLGSHPNIPVPPSGQMPSRSRDTCNPLSPDSTTTDGKNKLNSNNKPSV